MVTKKDIYKDFEQRDIKGRRWLIESGKCKYIKTYNSWKIYKLVDKYFAIDPIECSPLLNSIRELENVIDEEKPER